MTQNPDVSFVVPVFNAGNRPAVLTKDILEETSKAGLRVEIILVNDGSTDESWETIVSLADAYPDSVKGINLMRNRGQHHATLCGLMHAAGSDIITMDDDHVFSAAQALELLRYMQSGKLDLAWGLAEKQPHSVGRNLGRYLLYISSSIGTKKVAGASFRAMKGNLVRHLSNKGDIVFLDDLLTQITQHVGYCVFKTEKTSLKSRYRGSALLKMALRVMLFYSGFPLRMMTYAGFIGSMISGLAGLYYLVKKLFFRAPEGYTSVIVAILFSASALMLGMGILGEYLYRIHGRRHEADSYHVREIKGRS